MNELIKNKSVFFFSVFLYTLALSFIVSCGNSDFDTGEGADSVTGDDSQREIGVVDNNSFWVRVRNVGATTDEESSDPDEEEVENTVPPVEILLTEYFSHEVSAFDSACEINKDSIPSDETIECLIEGPELDMQNHGGVSIHYNVPKDMCDYFEIKPFAYWQAYPGRGPAKVFIDESSAMGATCEITDDSGARQTCPTTRQQAFQMGLRAFFNGDVQCAYDYTNNESLGEAPNCCIGDYELVRTDSSGTDTSDQEWGGKPGNCLSGPGTRLAVGADETTAYPLHEIKPVAITGINDVLNVTDATSGISDYYNFDFANFIEDENNPPAAFGAITNPNNETFSRDMVQNPSNYYQFTCIDKADEVIARINLRIREWNDKESFLQYKEAGLGGANSSGAETGITGDIQDIWDWKDIEDSTQTGLSNPPIFNAPEKLPCFVTGVCL